MEAILERPSRKSPVLHASRALAAILRITTKLLVVLLFLGGGLFIGGFLKFTSQASETKPASELTQSDGIVVLTGGSLRIQKGLELLKMGKAKRLLISGVNEETTREDLLKLNSPHADLFQCCIDLERVARNTLGNAMEARKWADKNGYSSIILVTSAHHVPRSLMEFRRHLPNTKIATYPVALNSIEQEGWWKDEGALRLMVGEYIKYIGAWSRDYLKADTIKALQATVLGQDA